MQYNAKVAKLCPFPYYWLARFTDGEEISQYNADGKEVLYQEVLNKLQSGKGLLFVAWVPTEKGKPTYVQHIDSSWQRPVVLRRHFVVTGIFDGKQKSHRVLFLLGWQATIAGKNYKSIIFIDPQTGNVEVGGE